MKAASASSKIVSKPKLLQIVSEWRERGETISFTNGVFDLGLHEGHCYSIREAKKSAVRLVVGVNSDRSARQLGKGAGRPRWNEKRRAKSIADLGEVDLVIIFDEPTPYDLLSQLKPDIIVKGDDYKEEDVVGHEFAKRVQLVSKLKGYSTSSIDEKMYPRKA